MEISNDADVAVKQIFMKYQEFAKKTSIAPRIILVPKGTLDTIEDEWLDVTEAKFKKKQYRSPSVPDAVMFGAMIIEIEWLDEITVY